MGIADPEPAETKLFRLLRQSHAFLGILRGKKADAKLYIFHDHNPPDVGSD